MKTLAIVAAAAAGTMTAAQAATLVTFGYNNLEGKYTAVNGNLGTYSAKAVDQGVGGLQTDGSVARLVPGAGVSKFAAGFKSLPSLANFTISISFIRTSATAGNGAGSFTATDAIGNTVSGSIAGVWSLQPTIGIAFNGVLSNVNITSNATFTGTDVSSTNWNTNLPAAAPYTGAVTQLVFNSTNMFNSSFDNIATQVSGQIVPSAGSMALFGLGGLVAARRRRA
ncbi:MAG: PEP-CTERM sorting domain-containing protein [Phycisphaerales bacterium]|nr:PEP-CTERM sorting domain-containing protein [Phycisphaerales bacterium]